MNEVEFEQKSRNERGFLRHLSRWVASEKTKVFIKGIKKLRKSGIVRGVGMIEKFDMVGGCRVFGFGFFWPWLGSYDAKRKNFRYQFLTKEIKKDIQMQYLQTDSTLTHSCGGGFYLYIFFGVCLVCLFWAFGFGRSEGQEALSDTVW